MAKYDPLRDYLLSQTLEELELSFSNIEQILKDTLPKSKFRPQFWANTKVVSISHPQRNAIRDSGYDAFLINGADKVRFVKVI
jgi:hypothetical protein